jgi:hypothetical protein
MNQRSMESSDSKIYLGNTANIYGSEINQSIEPIRNLAYKHFIICIKCIYLQNKYLITPYGVGKDKKSLAMVLPSEVVKTLGINPQSIFLLLKVNGTNDLQLQIIREEDLAKKEKVIPVAIVQQESEAFVVTGGE